MNKQFGNKKADEFRYLGVDIGGSHITAAEVFPENQEINTESKVRMRVDSQGIAESILNTWTAAISTLLTDSDHSKFRIGIAMPGPFDYVNGISKIRDLHKYDALYGLDIRKELSERLAVRPENIIFRNDAEAFLQGELVFNGIQSSRNVIGVTLGTGLGSAKSIKGEVKDVSRAFQKWGEGIAEDYISTRWFLKRYEELAGAKISNVEALVREGTEELKDKIFAEFADNLGRFLNQFAQEEDADFIVIGGNIAKTRAQFIACTKNKITKPGVQVLQTTLWEDAALIGAACSFMENKIHH